MKFSLLNWVANMSGIESFIFVRLYEYTYQTEDNNYYVMIISLRNSSNTRYLDNTTVPM